MWNESVRLGCEVKKLSRAINYNLEKILSEKVSGLTYMQARVITYLSRHDGEAIYQRDLEKAFQIRGPSVTSLLQVMEKNDLIIRSRVSHDARLKRLELTEKSIQIDQAIEECVVRHEALIRAGLTEEETKTFLSLMQKIEQNLQ